MQVMVRPCFDEDLTFVRLIYAHHVHTGFGTFDVEPPSEPDMRARWARIVGAGWPFIVASGVADPSRILGYAYAQPFRERAAYAATFEDSVYVAPTLQGRGIGRILLGKLLGDLAEGGAREVVAVIGDSANRASIRLHAGLGFDQVGLLRAVGRKFGRDVDVVLMQRSLHPAAAATSR